MSPASLHPDAPRQPALHQAIRFALEVATLAAYGWWGWHLGDGGLTGIVLALLLPVLGGSIWAVFRTPGDGAGRALMPVPGPVRLVIELSLIGIAAYGVWTAGSRAAAETLLTAWGLHYAVTWEYVRWLWHRRSVAPAR